MGGVEAAAATAEIPWVRGLPGIGVLVPFARDSLGFVERAAREGDLVHYQIVDHTLLQLSHPDLIEEVLVDKARSMHKDAIYDLLHPLLGKGLVTSEGDLWRRHRKLAAPSFGKRHVEHYADEFVRCTTTWLDGLATGEERNVHADFMALTQRIVLNTLFGTDLAVDTTQVAHAIETVMDGFVYEAQGIGRLLPGWLRTPTRRRADAGIQALDQVIYALIAARREAGPGNDLLSRLIEARDEEGGGLTDRELRDEAVTMFVAGHETTALALTYAIVLLGENPHAWGPLQAEVDEVLGDRAPTAADMARLRYTTAVIQETMRVLPPVWAIGREAQEDLTVGGRPVRKGTQLLMSQWVVHHDPRWFEDPLVFRPERWLDGLEQRLPRMAYLPFGGGPRVCIGNHFALLEAVTVLALVARRVKLVRTGARPRLSPSITLRPLEPVPARVELRRPA